MNQCKDLSDIVHDVRQQIYTSNYVQFNLEIPEISMNFILIDLLEHWLFLFDRTYQLLTKQYFPYMCC